MARRVSRTDRNLWSAFLGEAKANRLYTAYAWKALEEGYPDVAEVFLQVAGSETAHALSHIRVAGEVRSTRENLVSVLQDEAYEIETMYPRMIREAEAEGRPDAAATFRLAWEGERRHLRLFRETLEGKGWEPSKPVARPGLEVQPAELLERSGLADEAGDEKARIAALRRIREVIFGMQDGLISTAILVSSVYGATGNAFPTIVAGLAGALGGAVSMSSGSFLSSRAEKEVLETEIAREAQELQERPAEETAEMIELLRRDGLSEEDAIAVAETLARNEGSMLRTMVEKELGLSPELPATPWKDAVTMGTSFTIGAAIPILPYFFLNGTLAVVVSLAATGAGLFVMGVGKTRITRRNPVVAGLEVLGLGVAAATIGYLLGTVVPGLLGA